MLKLSQINEGLWNKGINRNKTGQLRKEFSLNPVDIGCNVFWSDKNLVINGKEEFTFKDIEKLNLDGWRLPTNKDIEDLKSQCTNQYYIDVDEDLDTFILKFKNDTELIFPQTHESEYFNVWKNVYLMIKLHPSPHPNEREERLLWFYGETQSGRTYRTIIHGEPNDNKPHHVRLVKDK